MSVTLRTTSPVWVLDLGNDENRFSPELINGVDQALTEITESCEPAALMITATGKFFSNGLDLMWLQSNIEEWDKTLASVQAMFARVLTLPVPTVCAINGHCFAAGAMLALACDYRVMRTEQGFYSLPAIDIKIPLTLGMTSLIQAKLTPRSALDVMTTGWRYDAPSALDAGIVDSICDARDLLDVARDLVSTLAGKDRQTLSTFKTTIYRNVIADLAIPTT